MAKAATGIDYLFHLSLLSNKRQSLFFAVSWLGESNSMIFGKATENINFILLSSTTDMLICYKESNGFRIVERYMLR